MLNVHWNAVDGATCAGQDFWTARPVTCCAEALDASRNPIARGRTERPNSRTLCFQLMALILASSRETDGNVSMDLGEQSAPGTTLFVVLTRSGRPAYPL